MTLSPVQSYVYNFISALKRLHILTDAFHIMMICLLITTYLSEIRKLSLLAAATTCFLESLKTGTWQERRVY